MAQRCIKWVYTWEDCGCVKYKFHDGHNDEICDPNQMVEEPRQHTGMCRDCGRGLHCKSHDCKNDEDNDSQNDGRSNRNKGNYSKASRSKRYNHNTHGKGNHYRGNHEKRRREKHVSFPTMPRLPGYGHEYPSGLPSGYANYTIPERFFQHQPVYKACPSPESANIVGPGDCYQQPAVPRTWSPLRYAVPQNNAIPADCFQQPAVSKPWGHH
ncbi:hypothetical protein BT63DRAFT_473549 [Microthyrium microscopicum]|uniref:Uncharacterized protein n=1 Tax=Microthyrium microscopicum TaxID=703497 RepID=A0A6A6U4I8_9PEZI|nr:hypothetical protein BT63DRAFT_473549 [Microthyrium microscopicum]